MQTLQVKKNIFSAIFYSQVEYNTLPLNAAKVYFYTKNLWEYMNSIIL